MPNRHYECTKNSTSARISTRRAIDKESKGRAQDLGLLVKSCQSATIRFGYSEAGEASSLHRRERRIHPTH